MKLPSPAIALVSVLVSSLAGASGWTLVAPAAAATRVKAAASAIDLGAPRHARTFVHVHRNPLAEPHYYARPVYYRPYPYGVPAPFVFGYGRWSLSRRAQTP